VQTLNLKTMVFEEIIPHLNKLASIYLVNNKRRTGYIFADTSANEGSGSREVVYFLTIMKGRRVSALDVLGLKNLEKLKEEIPVGDIVRIKSIDL
jgi:hypothetical protein